MTYQELNHKSHKQEKYHGFSHREEFQENPPKYDLSDGYVLCTFVSAPSSLSLAVRNSENGWIIYSSWFSFELFAIRMTPV